MSRRIRRWLGELRAQTLFIEPGEPLGERIIVSFIDKLREQLQMVLWPPVRGVHTGLDLLGHGHVAQAIGSHQHQPRTPNEAMPQRAGENACPLSCRRSCSAWTNARLGRARVGLSL